MTWTAVWTTATGALVSVGTQVASPLPSGLSTTDLGANPPTGVWDNVNHTFVPSTLKSVLTLRAFWDRWTAAERESLMNLQLTGTQTQKNKLAAFKDYVHDAGVVDCNDAYIQTCVNLAESAGIIAAGRAAVILA